MGISVSYCLFTQNIKLDLINSYIVRVLISEGKLHINFKLRSFEKHQAPVQSFLSKGIRNGFTRRHCEYICNTKLLTGTHISQKNI